jgi:glutamate synthase (NADPH/NADH) large chain
MLRATGLRSRIRVSTDGGLKTGRDVAVAALLGAEEYIFGTASLVTSGCVMARQCHANTCPVGVATQREDLRERFPGQPEHVINYMTFIAEELREIMAELGFRTLEEMIGRPGVLRQRSTDHPKASAIDLSRVLADPGTGARTKTTEQAHPDVATQLDHEIIEAAEDAIERGAPVALSYPISNVNRAVGAMVSHEISVRHGAEGLADDTIQLTFDGIAGQSFGAFLAPGVTMQLRGASNDYIGKGLSGGRIVVQTPPNAGYAAAENVVIGNVAFYGATSGEAYINGIAGERFCVRNSGVKAVVEGVGDHGCEYMTGGVAVILGGVGRNFAAGMSGGVAYVYDPDDTLERQLNGEFVTVGDQLNTDDEAMIRRMLENHVAYTDSVRATALLEEWAETADHFKRVLPEAYADVIADAPEMDVRTDRPPAAGVTPLTAAGDSLAQTSDD